MMTKNTTTIPVTAAIIQKDNKILIAKRASDKHLAGYWEFPGGKIEDEETDELCLVRELQEEMGIEVAVKGFFMENTHQYKEKRVLLKAYFCEIIKGDIVLNDHDEYAWINKNEFENYHFAPADVPFVKALV